jgi:hypothetical protein
MMLSVSVHDAKGQLVESGLSMNDAVISRGGKSRILTLDLTIDGVFLERLPGEARSCQRQLFDSLLTCQRRTIVHHG